MNSMERTIAEMQITCGSDVEARAIADTLVDGHFAANVQQLPIRSTFRWAGSVERDEEILLLVKTTRARVEAAVLDIHSYDVPAITVAAVAGGSEPYLEWVREATR